MNSFLSISFNMCFGCSKERSYRDVFFSTHYICFGKLTFIPRHFKKCGVLCYTLHSKNCVQESVYPYVRTCPRYIMRFAICTAVFSEVRLGLVQYGVMGLNGLDGVSLTRLTPSICNG